MKTTEQPFRPNRPVRPIVILSVHTVLEDAAKPRSLTDTVDVSLDIGTTSARSQVGHVIVNNHVHSRNIDTSSNDVGSNENLGLTIPEAVKDSITFLGELVTVERSNGMAFGNKTLGNMVGGDFSLQRTSG